jgi:hypothetical protein
MSRIESNLQGYEDQMNDSVLAKCLEYAETYYIVHAP